MSESNYKLLLEMRDNIIEYLEGEKRINEEALKAYEPKPIQEDINEEIRLIREREAIKLRDRIYELNRHIEVIKRMYPKQ